MAMAPTSPRLPSPPPPVENQIGPKSPSGGAAADIHTTPMEQSLLDANSKRRIHPGTKAADMAAGPPLIPLNELDSAFQLQEHLAALHFHHTANGSKPLSRDTALLLAQPPIGIDRTLWLYELCRFLISQCNSLIVGFLFDTPACSASTCPEMRASEWQFLCAVHEQPKSCCAIDYCCHTLDWAANVVTDQKLFPSRFVVLPDAHSKNVGVKNLVNVFRRLHRIFAHAWFQHRSVFWSVEGQSGLYVFFKTVCDLYDLLPAENYKLPPEAEGLETAPVEPEPERLPPSITKPQIQQRINGNDDIGRTNTRRHIRSSPSTGSAVTTVPESDEEDADGVTRKVRRLQISAPDSLVEEPEVAEVPMAIEPSIMTVSAPQDYGTADTEVPEDDQTVVEMELTETDTAEEAADAAKEPKIDEVPKDTEETLEATAALETAEEESKYDSEPEANSASAESKDDEKDSAESKAR